MAKAMTPMGTGSRLFITYGAMDGLAAGGKSALASTFSVLSAFWIRVSVEVLSAITRKGAKHAKNAKMTKMPIKGWGLNG